MLGLRLDEPFEVNGEERVLDRDAVARLTRLGLLSPVRGAQAHAQRAVPGRRRDCRAARVAVKSLQMEAVQLTDRQRDILRRLVEEYIATGLPVGSKYLVERAGLSVSPSTVRSELAELERLGLLTHPHTSAGRARRRRAIGCSRKGCSTGWNRVRRRSRST